MIQVYCDLIGYIEENGRLNNMAAGPKMWRKSPDPTQRSEWGLGTRLIKYLLTLRTKLTWHLTRETMLTHPLKIRLWVSVVLGLPAKYLFS